MEIKYPVAALDRVFFLLYFSPHKVYNYKKLKEKNLKKFKQVNKKNCTKLKFCSQAKYNEMLIDKKLDESTLYFIDNSLNDVVEIK